MSPLRIAAYTGSQMASNMAHKDGKENDQNLQDICCEMTSNSGLRGQTKPTWPRNPTALVSNDLVVNNG